MSGSNRARYCLPSTFIRRENTFFFKPDTRDWFGGIPAVGLGLATAKYGDSTSADDDQPIFDALGQELENIIRDQVSRIHGELIGKILLPEGCANLAFGGKNHDELYMTARRSLYRIKLILASPK